MLQQWAAEVGRGGAMASLLSGNDRIGHTDWAVWPPRAFRLQIYPPWDPLSFAGVRFRGSVTALCERTGYMREKSSRYNPFRSRVNTALARLANVNKDEITSKTRQALFPIWWHIGSKSVSARCNPVFLKIWVRRKRERVLFSDAAWVPRHRGVDTYLCIKDIKKCILHDRSPLSNHISPENTDILGNDLPCIPTAAVR